ncbi:MAG: hypothetical protein WAO61_04605 [Solirubrobacterales bacterium]
MTRRRDIACALALTVLIGVPGVVPASSAARTSYVQASAREFYYGLSRPSVRPGPVRFEMVNFGEDDHDLAISRKGGTTIAQLGIVKPGDRGTVEARLRRGSYVLWCTISDHKARGMRAVLKVRAARKKRR